MGGKVTGGDCYDLWQVGAIYLRQLADTYEGINSAFTKLDEGTHKGKEKRDESFRFKRFHESEDCVAADAEDKNMSSDTGPVYPAYVALRDRMHDIFFETANNLRETGYCVELAAWEYAACDKANGDALDVLKDKIGNGNYLMPDGESPSEKEKEELAKRPKDIDDVSGNPVTGDKAAKY